jgi:hypothetical protein
MTLVCLQLSARGACKVALLSIATLVTACEAWSQTEAQLFPQPFLVEHHVEQTDPDGGRFATEPCCLPAESAV